MGFYIEEIPTEFNGITMEEADYLADEFLKDEPCNRMWDAMRALRDFYETVISEAVDVKNTANTPQTEDYDFRDEQEYNDRWQTECDRYVITNDEGDKAYNCIGCQTDCGWK